jgi:anti-sigma regulatory factor (Ser/Thr protein kinase)
MTIAANEVIHLRIPSRLELLGLLDRVAMLICERAGFDEDACAQVTLAVIEAGTNAIQHGSRGQPDRSIEVDFGLRPDRLEIAVRDRGPGFDPALVGANVTAPEHLLDSRGRGIFIMRACMDTVDFRFDGTGTTCLLVKRRPAAG